LNLVPILFSVGISTCSRNSDGGENGTSVPPVTVSDKCPGKKGATGISVCSTSVIAPAVPMLTLNVPVRIVLGA